MKILNKIFYDILLKIDKGENDKFMINGNLLTRHLGLETERNDEILNKITNYFNSFYDYCFELEDNIMLKGQINFKD